MRANIRQRLEYNRRKPAVEQILLARAQEEKETLERMAWGASEEAWAVMMEEWRRESE